MDNWKEFSRNLFKEELNRELDIDPDTATMDEVNTLMAKISKYMLEALESHGLDTKTAILMVHLSIAQAGMYYDLRKRIEDREK